jgi:Bacterial Ig-like domain (group 3)/FG-GAP-like repeat
MFRKNAFLALGCLASLLSLAQASFCVGGLFQPAEIYYPGAPGAQSIALGDVNGDGKVDMLVGVGWGWVGVLLGNGDGTFQTEQTYNSGGNNAQSIVIRDVNRDGKLDVLVANFEGPAGVLLGNGDGTFQTARTYGSGGHNSYMIAAEDMNGDGNIDLAIASSCTSTCETGVVGVLLGNGDGTFQTVRTFSSGAYGAMAIAVADVNGDRKPDLLVANYCYGKCHGSASVLLGNGDGTFQGAQIYDSGGFFGWSITVEDVNRDGKPDLLVSDLLVSDKNRVHGLVGVLLGNGDGTFQTVRTFSSGGFQPYSIAVGDVNGDGKPDLLMGNYCLSENSCPGGGAGVLLGNGDGTFQTAQRYGSGDGSAVSIAVGDVNGDGKPDLLVGGQTGGVGVMLARYITVTSLKSVPNPSFYGQAVTLTATVSTDGPSAPAGIVTFRNGNKWLGKATLSDGMATLTTTRLPLGTLSITARYNGDKLSVKSTSPALIQVVQ